MGDVGSRSHRHRRAAFLNARLGRLLAVRSSCLMIFLLLEVLLFAKRGSGGGTHSSWSRRYFRQDSLASGGALLDELAASNARSPANWAFWSSRWKANRVQPRAESVMPPFDRPGRPAFFSLSLRARMFFQRRKALSCTFSCRARRHPSSFAGSDAFSSAAKRNDGALIPRSSSFACRATTRSCSRGSEVRLRSPSAWSRCPRMRDTPGITGFAGGSLGGRGGVGPAAFGGVFGGVGPAVFGVFGGVGRSAFGGVFDGVWPEALLAAESSEPVTPLLAAESLEPVAPPLEASSELALASKTRPCPCLWPRRSSLLHQRARRRLRLLMCRLAASMAPLLQAPLSASA